jgi:hypothetical protein
LLKYLPVIPAVSAVGQELIGGFGAGPHALAGVELGKQVPKTRPPLVT